jgi:predicted transcriptional regulator
MVTDDKKLVGLPPFEDAPFLQGLSPQERELVQQILERHPKFSVREAMEMARKEKS